MEQDWSRRTEHPSEPYPFLDPRFMERDESELKETAWVVQLDKHAVADIYELAVVLSHSDQFDNCSLDDVLADLIQALGTHWVYGDEREIMVLQRAIVDMDVEPEDIYRLTSLKHATIDEYPLTYDAVYSLRQKAAEAKTLYVEDYLLNERTGHFAAQVEYSNVASEGNLFSRRR